MRPTDLVTAMGKTQCLACTGPEMFDVLAKLQQKTPIISKEEYEAQKVGISELRTQLDRAQSQVTAYEKHHGLLPVTRTAYGDPNQFETKLLKKLVGTSMPANYFTVYVHEGERLLGYVSYYTGSERCDYTDNQNKYRQTHRLRLFGNPSTVRQIIRDMQKKYTSPATIMRVTNPGKTFIKILEDLGFEGDDGSDDDSDDDNDDGESDKDVQEVKKGVYSYVHYCNDCN